MNNRYLYLRETSYQKDTDELTSYFFKNHIYIDYGLDDTSLKKMIMVVKAHDEVVLRTFAHLGTSNNSMMDNINYLIKKGVLITSIDEKINTEEPLTWIMSITILIVLFNKIIGFLSAERLLNKRNSGVHVGRRSNKNMKNIHLSKEKEYNIKTKLICKYDHTEDSDECTVEYPSQFNKTKEGF